MQFGRCFGYQGACVYTRDYVHTKDYMRTQKGLRQLPVAWLEHLVIEFSHD
jgi:hypothetical protein